MAATLDIFAPQISQVAKGLEGKVILVYGTNNTGKTYTATKMKKPFYLPFESGLNAISGIPFCPINSWADFIKINKQLTSATTVEKARETYSTIIFDEVSASANYCQEYICAKYGATSIGEGNGGYGLWKEYETEYWRQINKLVGAGYCVYFIAHEKVEQNGFISPKGDKRAIGPIIDNTDICVYVHPNGVDDKGKVIRSSGYLAQTDQFFARSRFDYIDTYMEEFSAENLEKLIIEAVERQEEAEGITAVSFDEQQAQKVAERRTYEELMDELSDLGNIFVEKDLFDDLTRIVEENLGAGKKASDLKKGQEQVIEVLIADMKEFLEAN